MSFDENLCLLSSFLLFFGLAFVLPTLRVWRQTGRSPYVLPSSDDAYGFVTLCMKLLMAALLAYTVSQAIWPELVTAISIVDVEAAPILRGVGWTALATALAWTVCAQYQMGQSWRIGIDTQQKTKLVTTGLFALSRNPIFLAMRVCLFALVLLQPNAITLALFVAGDLIMQFQARLEEAFLRDEHGPAYRQYCSRVRRWL